MNYPQAIEHAIALRLRVKNESDQERRQKLLELAQDWEVWADYCREKAAKGEVADPANIPAEDIEDI